MIKELKMENINFHSSWKMKTLAEVYDVKDGTHDSPKYIDEGYALITSKNLKNNELNYNKVKYISEQDYININQRSKVDKGDVLFAMIGTIGNPIVIKTEPDFAIKNVALFKVPQNQDSYFLKYYLDSSFVINKMSKDAKGATQKFVGLGYLRNFPISLPPITQQKQIVSILDKAFAAIDTAKANAKQNLQNSKELFESYLQDVFENKGDDWVSCELNEFVNFIDYRGRTPVKTSSGVRLITAKNIKLGYLQKEPEEFIADDNYEAWMKRGIPNFGDVIFTTEAPLGHIAQVNTKEKLAFAQRVIVMQPDAKKMNQTFLKYLLLSNPIRNKILAQATGATVLGIKSRLLKKIKIDFPDSIEEQEQIVVKLDAISAESKKLEAIYSQKITDLEEMKKSVLQKAFNGELKTEGVLV